MKNKSPCQNLSKSKCREQSNCGWITTKNGREYCRLTNLKDYYRNNPIRQSLKVIQKSMATQDDLKNVERQLTSIAEVAVDNQQSIEQAEKLFAWKEELEKQSRDLAKQAEEIKEKEEKVRNILDEINQQENEEDRTIRQAVDEIEGITIEDENIVFELEEQQQEIQEESQELDEETDKLARKTIENIEDMEKCLNQPNRIWNNKKQRCLSTQEGDCRVPFDKASVKRKNCQNITGCQWKSSKKKCSP